MHREPRCPEILREGGKSLVSVTDPLAAEVQLRVQRGGDGHHPSTQAIGGLEDKNVLDPAPAQLARGDKP